MRAIALVALALVSCGPAPKPDLWLVHSEPRAIPTFEFSDEKGAKRGLADYRSKVVLLNLWATWCAPCRKEMPALDRLHAAISGTDIEIVAISIDRSGLDGAKGFYRQYGIRNLPIYLESSGQAERALKAFGMPIAYIIDRSGREHARHIGPAEWDSAEMVERLKRFVDDLAKSGDQRADQNGDVVRSALLPRSLKFSSPIKDERQ